MNCLCCGILFADVACLPIDHVPREGELVRTEKIELILGGCAANVAVDLAKLHVPVVLSGCVGDDAFSSFILKTLEESGIDTNLVHQVSGSCPGTSIHLNVQNQDRRFVSTSGANRHFVIDDSLRQHVAAAPPGILYIGGFFMLNGLENEQTLEFLDSVQKRGWKVVLDIVMNGDRPYKKLLEPILPFVDVFMPNRQEAEAVADCTGIDKTDVEKLAKSFLEKGAKNVIITQGEEGAYFSNGTESFQTGIYSTDYVSGSGAGDAFCAGVIASLLESGDMRQAIRWGSALGGSCVRSIGTTATVFSRNELLHFLEENRLEFIER